MKKQKFELKTLDPTNLAELAGWKQKQTDLVKENPFIEIVDPETYKEAKKRRTALKTGRTDLQKQDGTIGSFLSNFRKDVKAVTNDLVVITKEGEEQQQEAIDQWELGIQWCKEIEEGLEEERVENIKEMIKTVETNLSTIIDEMEFPNIKEREKVFKSGIEIDYDFAEYDFLFEEMVERKRQDFVEKTKTLCEEETDRIEQLEKDQQAKINEIKLECFDTTEFVSFENKDTLIEKVEKIVDIEYDFGKYQHKFEEMVATMKNKAKIQVHKLEKEEERRQVIEAEEQRNRVINTREGLLDLVFQLDIDNYEEEKGVIEKALEQSSDPVPLALDEYDKMIERVTIVFDKKSQEISVEIENEKHSKRTEKRIERIEDLGFSSCGSGQWGLDGYTSGLYWETIHNEIDEEFEKTIQFYLDIKDKEVKKVNKEEETRLVELLKIRIKMAVKTGLKNISGVLTGFGYTIDSDLFKYNTEDEFDEWLETVATTIKEHKSKDRKEKLRQKRIAPERKRLINFVNLIRDTELNYTFKQPAMIEGEKMIKASLNVLCDELIEQLKSI